MDDNIELSLYCVEGRTAPRMRGNRATRMRAVNAQYGRALIPLHFNNSTSHAMAKNKAVSASMRADLNISHREQMRVIDRLHRTQTELHSKLIILAERRSEIAKATELRKQEQTKSKQQQQDTEQNPPQDASTEDKDENEMEELETLQENSMSEDAESQGETKSPGVSSENEADAKDSNFPKARRKRAPVRKNSKEDKMKRIRNFQRSNSQSRDAKEDTRKSHDLKQKVRKVRFLLPFSASLETKHKVGTSRAGGKNLTIDTDKDDTMTALVTQLKRLRTTQIYNESLDTYSENETGTIEEESVGTGSYIDGSEAGWAEVAGTEEDDDRSRVGSVSKSSVTSSRNSNRKFTKKVTPSSGDEAKRRLSYNQLVRSSARFQQLVDAMKKIEKYENIAASQQHRTQQRGAQQPDEQDVFPYKARGDGEFEPLLVPYKRRTFPIPTPASTVRRLHMLEREALYTQERVERSDELLNQVQKAVGNPRRKVSIMISDELVEVPHLPGIDTHAQQEQEVRRPRKLSVALQHQYSVSNGKLQRAASTTTVARGVSQNALLRTPSADTVSANYTESAIYRLDNLKGGKSSNARQMSATSSTGSDAMSELANKIAANNRATNRNAKYNSRSLAPITATLGHILNTLDTRLVSRKCDPDTILALRDCRYIRIYASSLKRSKTFRRASSWNMPGNAHPSGGHNKNYVASGR